MEVSYAKLRRIQEQMALKIYSFNNPQDFASWINGMTKDKFKALAFASVAEVLSDRDAEEAEILEFKSLIK